MINNLRGGGGEGGKKGKGDQHVENIPNFEEARFIDNLEPTN